MALTIPFKFTTSLNYGNDVNLNLTCYPEQKGKGKVDCIGALSKEFTKSMEPYLLADGYRVIKRESKYNTYFKKVSWGELSTEKYDMFMYEDPAGIAHYMDTNVIKYMAMIGGFPY